MATPVPPVTAGGDTHFLDVMRTEIWPQLADRAPISKQDREAILGYDPDIGI